MLSGSLMRVLVLLAVLLPLRWSLAADLLPAEEAFRPTVFVNDGHVELNFEIAHGYYLYRDKVSVETEPAGVLDGLAFDEGGVDKEDEFFGRQTVFYRSLQARAQTLSAQTAYRMVLRYQGCADAGVCYPPVEKVLDIKGAGVYDGGSPPPAFRPSAEPLLQSAPPPSDGGGRFSLSRETLAAGLLVFFVSGIGMSLTACMYPLLPIVSGIVVGSGTVSKRRALLLSAVYVQGMAAAYALVGVLAGSTGSLLTVWLQQPWVVLAGAALLVVMALAMFDVLLIQLPVRVQSFFQSQSSRLSGGRLASVFAMGVLSALIVGPCVAPPLAVAVGYIGRTGDALLGGAALYSMALGSGLPLMLAATFGAHVLPRAGAWMNGVKYAFGVLLLLAAVYLAAPFLPYAAAVVLYAGILAVCGGVMLVKMRRHGGAARHFLGFSGSLLLVAAVFFAVQSGRMQTTFLHHALTLFPPRTAEQAVPHRVFAEPDRLHEAVAAALADGQPVLLDFYADWCVSCKEMEAKTFNRPEVQQAVPLERMFQIDMTEHTPQQQEMLKEYGLFGPPGLFVLYPDGRRSDPLIGFAPPQEFIEWYRRRQQP